MPAYPRRQLQQTPVPEARRHMKLFLLVFALGQRRRMPAYPQRQLQQDPIPEARRHM